MLKIQNLAVLILFMCCQQAPPNAKSQNKRAVQSGEKRFDIKSYKITKFALSSGKIVEAFIADSTDRQTQGLSGIKQGELQNNQGMIFTYSAMSIKQFWMPNTYINLDIFFMNKEFKVLHIDRNVKAHPSLKEPIPRSSSIYSQNILELPSLSPISSEIKVGMTLKRLN